MYVISEIDYQKGVPAFALRQILKDKGFMISSLRNLMPKWKKMYPYDTPEKVKA